MRVALVTQFDGTDAHTDGPPMLAALADAGIDAHLVPWGPPRDWSAYDGVVVRNAWDYVDRRDEFLDWARSVEAVTRFANPVAMLAWNSDKRYLRDLADAGVPIVPTVWVAPGEPVPPVPWDDADELVVKPSVSAGSRGAARYGTGDEDRARLQAHVDAIGAGGGTAMVQPYLAAVDAVGEAGTYVFGGEVSHAITKGAVLRPGAPPPDDFSLSHGQSSVAAEVTPELVAFATDVLARLPEAVGAPLYARVDALRRPDGGLALLELEVFEPFLYFETDPGAPARFARAVRAWLRR